MLLAEIENLGTVSWKYETEAGEKTFTVTATDASKLAGQDIKDLRRLRLGIAESLE